MKAPVVVSCILLLLQQSYYCNGIRTSDIMNRLRSRTQKDNTNDESENDIDNDDPDVSVFIGYKRSSLTNDTGTGDSIVGEDMLNKPFFAGLDLSKIRLRSRYRLSDSISATIKKSQIESMMKDNPNIEYIEIDPIVHPDGETLLYGMDMIQAGSLLSIPNTINNTFTSSCNDPNSFKIGVSTKQRTTLILFLS
jgi:hypothetical protein